MTRHDGPVLVTGDFNTSESNPAMTFFHGRTALRNDSGESVRNPRPLVDTYKFIHPESSERLIDHVLAGPGIRIRKAGRITSGKASDHDIIWATVSLE